MKFKNILYIIFMVIFIAFAYLLFDRGINIKTKKIVNYQEDSDVIYKVYLKDNDIYSEKYLNMNERYITDMVDYIALEFNYNSLFDKDINGYYSYIVTGNLVAYEDDITDSLWEKEYTLLPLKANVLDQNELRQINIDDKLTIDYNKYRDEIAKFKKDYHIDIRGYLEVIIKIKTDLSFSDITKNYEENKEIKLIVPLSYETFKISITNDNNKVDNYYAFSKKERVNYLLILMGLFSLSIGLSFLALTIRNMIKATKKSFDYQKELTKILTEYSDIIVLVKRFYNKKKYNLIYVDSFKELMDVYKRVGNPISFKEIKKNEEALFVMIEDDNAWIYKMVNK